MKNTLTKQNLAAIKKTLTRNPRLPILSTILVNDGWLRVTDLDMELSIDTTLPNGLYDKCVLDGVDIKAAYDAADFPVLRDCGDAVWQITMPIAEFRSDIEFVARSMSTEEVRYYLNGIHFNGADIVATNGHTLHCVTTRHDFTAPNHIIVPRKAIDVFLAASKGVAGDVTITCTQGTGVHFRGGFIFSLDGGSTVIRTKLIDGTFPDYKRVTPDITAPDVRSFTFIESDFVKLYKLFSKHPNKHHRAVKFDGHTATFIDADNPMHGTVSCAFPIEAGFNYKYLANAGITGKAYVSDASTPMCVEAGNRTYICMPMHV